MYYWVHSKKVFFLLFQEEKPLKMFFFGGYKIFNFAKNNMPFDVSF